MVSDDELRLIRLAEAEAPRGPNLYEPNDDNYPSSVLYPRLRNRDGLGFKPISEEGSTLGRAVDDANSAIEIVKIEQMRRSRD